MAGLVDTVLILVRVSPCPSLVRGPLGLAPRIVAVSTWTRFVGGPGLHRTGRLVLFELVGGGGGGPVEVFAERVGACDIGKAVVVACVRVVEGGGPGRRCRRSRR